MRRLTLAELKLCLKDLLEQRLDALRASLSGRIFEPLLREQLKQIEALPAEVVAGSRDDAVRPLAIADDYASLNAAIFFHLEWTVPRNLDPMIVEATRQVREAMQPDLNALKAQSVAESSIDGQSAKKSEELAMVLQRLSDKEKKPELDDFADAFGYPELPAELFGGNELSAIYSRGQLESPVAKDALELRNATFGMIEYFRRGLAEELVLNSCLPRSLDKDIFGYFDELCGKETQ